MVNAQLRRTARFVFIAARRLILLAHFARSAQSCRMSIELLAEAVADQDGCRADGVAHDDRAGGSMLTEPQAQESYRRAVTAYQNSWRGGEAPEVVLRLRDELKAAYKIWARLAMQAAEVVRSGSASP